MAILRRESGINFRELSSGTFSLLRKNGAEHRPACVSNALSKAMIFRHAFHIQLFNRNFLKAVHDFTGFLMHKVMATVANPFVDARYYFARFTALWRALLKLRQAPLRFGKRLLILAVKARVLNLFARRKRGKAGKANVHSNRFAVWFQRHGFHFNSETSKPLSVLAANGASLDFAFEDAGEQWLSLHRFWKA